MQTLTIFHDPECGLCTNFHRWLLTKRSYLPLEFLPYHSDAARKRFPQIDDLDAGSEIVVLADDGRWWQGPAAMLTCLWALRDHRELSYFLATPQLRPLVENICHLLSENRFKVSQLLKLEPEQLGALVEAHRPACTSGSCQPSNLQRAKLPVRTSTTSPSS